MKAEDHFQKALRLDAGQSQLDAAHYSELIIEGCYMAAHHYIEAGAEWRGIPHPQAHAHKDEIRGCSNRQPHLRQFKMPGVLWRHCAQVGYTAKRQTNQQGKRCKPLCRLSKIGPKRYDLTHKAVRLLDQIGQEGRMKNKASQKRAHLYVREYPRLLRQVRRLIELVPQDPNVVLLALFGSTARLEPDPYSDSDLLILLHNPRELYALDKTARIVQLIGEAEEAPYEEWCDWPFSGMVGNAQGSDLDADFLANVAHDGVLLYQQEGMPLPPALAGLAPFDAWLERVQALLAECERTLATKTLPRDVPA